MPVENEDKLVLRPGTDVEALPRLFPFLTLYKDEHITQGYLGNGIRIRRSNYPDGKTVRKLTFKTMTSIGLLEFEQAISAEDYNVLLAEKVSHGSLRKRRTSFSCIRTGLVLEVDRFETGDRERPSFLMAEVEHNSDHAYENLRDAIAPIVAHEVARSDRTFENARLATPDGMRAALARLDELGLPR